MRPAFAGASTLSESSMLVIESQKPILVKVDTMWTCILYMIYITCVTYDMYMIYVNFICYTYDMYMHWHMMYKYAYIS